MKIAWLTENLLYWNGGAKWILEISRRLRQRCELDIFVTRASAENKEIFGKANIEVKEFSNTATDNLRYWFFYPYYVWSNARKLKRLLAPYDVLISTNTDFIASRLNKRTIYTCLEPHPWIYSPAFTKGRPPIQRLLAKVGRPLARLYDQSTKRKSGWLVAVDKFNASRLQEIYGRLPTIIYVGVDSELFSIKHNPALEATYSDYEVIIHSSSHLSPPKGTPCLVEALSKIVKQVSNCRLLILNPHENEREQSELIKLAQSFGVASNIEFLPAVEEEDLPYYYSLAKVVIQPSIYPAGAHLPLVEGAACETPGITFSGIANVEDVVHGETGFIVPYGDIDALAQRTVEILKDSQLREQMGKQAREMAKNLFSWDRNAEIMWDLVQEITSKPFHCINR